MTATAAPTHPASGLGITGLSHVAIACADLAASLEFYTDVLGLAEHCRLNYQGTDRLMLVCLKISDRQWLELFDGRHLPKDAPALHQVAVDTADAEACRARLADLGRPVPAQAWRGQMRNRGFTTPDPRDIAIEFVEATAESWMARDRGRFLPADRLPRRLIEAGIAGPVDPDAVQAFYGEGMGLPVAFTRAGTWIVQVAEPDQAGVVERIVGDPRATACWFTVQVADLGAAAARVVQHRTAPLVSSGDGRLTVQDPDGMRIHLVAG